MKWTSAIIVLFACCGLMACSINQLVSLDRVAAQLEGNWVNEQYWDTLRITKSPKRAQKVSAIPIINIKKDTFLKPIHVVLSFQEGDEWLLDRDSSGLVFNNAYDVKQKLHAKLLSSQKMRLGKQVFIRYADIVNEEAQNYCIVEKTLFAGRYDWNGRLVEFGKDGGIKGMEHAGVEFYNPVVDYYNNEIEADQLWLGKKKKSNKYGFEFKGKKLYIYTLVCPNGESYCADDVILGDLVFELKGQ
jgi:hypothetical protein